MERVAAVERALAILDAFKSSDRYLPLAELARRTDIAKPTLLRLLESLIDHGLICRAADGSYYIGPASLRLFALHNAAARSGSSIVSTLDELVTKTGETASYSIRQREFRLYIYRTNSSHRLRTHIQPGDMSPIGQGATGRVLLAFEDPPSVKYAPIRAQMFAVSVGEMEHGMVGISCPVFSHEGKIVGAVSLSGPESRMDAGRVKQYTYELLRAASKITTDFGGRADLFSAALKGNQPKTRRSDNRGKHTVSI
jgi:DNA-binding IclR family transcriptional regulator